MIEICNECGGVRLFVQLDSNEYTEVDVPLPLTFCQGHTKEGVDSEVKHEGKLGGEGRDTQTVRYQGKEMKYISIRYDNSPQDDIWLSPAQALSLLAWLKQEEPTLRQIIKEDEEKKND